MKFLIKPGSKVLLKLEDGMHIMRLRNLTELSYPSMKTILMNMSYNGLLTLKDAGRLKKIYLTTKGRKVQKKVKELYEVI